jgi:SpoVK/Ycf46/Vps4 family AAA+-type ATPase
MSSAKHNDSGVDYYQEAVDVLKKYISNYPELIFSITTNMEPDFFDDTLIREGRLHPVHIPYPGAAQKVEMWKYFLKLFDIADDFTYEQYMDLAKAIPKEQGAFITEFCKSYIPLKKLEMEAAQSGTSNLLDVLARGCYMSMEHVKRSINYDGILKDVCLAVVKKQGKEENLAPVGFLN